MGRDPRPERAPFAAHGSALRRFLGTLSSPLHALYPARCNGCFGAVAEWRLLRHRLCAACLEQLASLSLAHDTAGERCTTCASPGSSVVEGAVRCLPCIIAPLPVGELRSLWRYRGPIEAMIRRYKFSSDHAQSFSLGPLLEEGFRALQSGPLAFSDGWDMCTVVPSGSRRIRERRFHHLGLLSRRLEAISGAPCAPFVLSVPAARPAQVERAIEDRFVGVAEAVTAAAHRVEGARVLLFDDVVTTGASVAAAAAALMRAGAARVDCLTFARSERFQKNRIAATLGRNGSAEKRTFYRDNAAPGGCDSEAA